ncbi:MAG: UDP-N-acetylmuramoyl-L-alanine--D-glutamate ligase [Clostridiales bacterium]|nr:UDP-N-acetylmuramoyl-L-alanine--D-glutamate ligase [Clostridiales bacterium]
MNYEKKKVLVVGMARSGVAAAQLLRACGADVTVNDSKSEAELGSQLKPLEGLQMERRFGCGAMELLDGMDCLVISPGIPDTAPFVVRAKEMGIYVIGELELAAQLSRGTLTAVSGTNGKTTTVSLLGEIFANSGRVTHVVGNIGYPFSLASLVSKPEDVIVCEVSSFQMETADTFHPHVALLTNITEDHLNRHGTMEVYTALKMRMFSNQTPEDYAVFNADDPGLNGLSRQVRSKVLKFSRKKEVREGAFVRDGQIMIRLDGTERRVCRADEIYIPGPHNLENALGAVCVAAAMKVPVPVIRHSLKTFRGVEHRIERVRELNGITYINDSKGTNVDSTIKAVQTMTDPTVIILGGYDKHTSFDPLSREIVNSPMIRKAVLIGETAGLIKTSLNRAGFHETENAQSLGDAVNKARASAGKGWNVLLSPACASFDMFKDYEERGRVFKEIVNELE